MSNEIKDLQKIRERLAHTHGKEYWRCLEELADSETFAQFLREQYPRHGSALIESVDRRGFLKFMGASLALAGMSACLSASPAPTDEKIVPYVVQPEEIIPGKPLYFASAMPLGGYGRGIVAESHMGRPTKIEGNPSHPASLGATDVFMQASILDLYDPDRAYVLNQAGRIATWNGFMASLAGEMAAQRLNRGAGLAVLTETVTSPTLSYQLQQLLDQFPKARWFQYDGAARDAARAGARRAFGDVVDTIYRFDRAEVILSLDSDFLFLGPAALRYAREFIDKRRAGSIESGMNRLYAVESTPTVTGSMADHRWALGPQPLQTFARAVARGLGIAGVGEAGPGGSVDQRAVDAVVRDLRNHRGRSVIVPGDHQPASLHALAHAMNQSLGNNGATVIYTEPVEAQAVEHGRSLRELVDAMAGGAVQTLMILGGNPVYTAPADLKFADLLVRTAFTVHLSPYENETSALCRWRVPEAHYLETWSDVRAFDGTASIIQPLIAPLYGGRTAHELLAVLLGEPERASYDLVRGFWQQQSKARREFEAFWRAALNAGVVPQSTARIREVSAKLDSAEMSAAQSRQTPAAAGDAAAKSENLVVLFRPDPSILDGRFANNGWLQELPKPFTKITWDNVILVSPAIGQKLGIERRVAGTGGERGRIFAELIELEVNGRRVRGAGWILPGQADDCITVHLGYGRARAGRVGTSVGFDASAIRTSEALWQGSGATLRKIGGHYAVACTQFHQVMEGRDLIRAGSLEQYRSNPDFLHAGEEQGHEASLYPGFKYEGNAWGMAIDLNACIGCNACVVACVAENNIPVVGKSEVMRGREMHWIRIDRYYKGTSDNPEMYHQPVPCMQCENAPCELVCPVHATTHSEDGLNDMTYNRCVGTRYCSNNCPYKVRRFNFFQYQDFTTPSLKLMRNPDVTVRSLGVMEKCTYCVQRIRQGQIEARKENRAVRDGEVTPACAQACPAQAIVFGDINDPDSRVAKLKSASLNYGLLTELNTRPRTTYLARLKNPNPDLAKE